MFVKPANTNFRDYQTITFKIRFFLDGSSNIAISDKYDFSSTCTTENPLIADSNVGFNSPSGENTKIRLTFTPDQSLSYALNLKVRFELFYF